MEREQILKLFPEANNIQINSAIKYQDKFFLNLENLKCLNPNCYRMKKWFDTKNGFSHTCGNKDCKETTKDLRYKVGSEKAIRTFLTKYGVSNPSQLEDIKKAKKETCLRNSGFEHNMQNPEHIKLREEHSIKKYGVSNPSKLEEVKAKLRAKPFRHQEHLHNLNNWNNSDTWLTFIDNELKFDYISASLYFNCRPVACYNQLQKLGITFKKWNTSSLNEKNIFDYVSAIIDSKINKNIRFPKINELDIYIPDHNLAIEFNGIYWHSYCPISFTSDKQTDIKYCKQRHLQKTESCQSQNIKLLHIFENEWINPVKQEIWKSVISNALGKSIKLGARKCILKPVPKKDIRPFLELNHLQGYGVSPIAYGLYHEDMTGQLELMSIMTFTSSKGRMDTKTDWELVRFCNKRGYNVQGAASRLLKAFRTEYPGSIKSYANRRWSNGNLYRHLGFKEIGISAPNHFYWHKSNSNNLISRQHLQKHKLIDKIEKFDSSLTAFQNITNAGYNIIWDSGNYVFLLQEEIT